MAKNLTANVLMPFALSLRTGQEVEIGEVARGRDCHCVCLCCGQSVQARQGDEREWHFSHDTGGEHKPHTQPCEFSFYSSLRRFIHRLIASGVAITTLATPGHTLHIRHHGHSLSIPITKPSFLGVASAVVDTTYDITIRLATDTKEEAVVHIWLSYPGRIDEPPFPENLRAGVLVLDLRGMPHMIKSCRSQSAMIRNLVIGLLEVDTSAKRWSFHPREPIARERALKHIEDHITVESQKAGLSFNEYVARYYSYSLYQPDSVGTSAASLGANDYSKPAPGRAGKFSCVGCAREWEGKEHSDAHCQYCRTHLFSRFTPGSSSAQNAD